MYNFQQRKKVRKALSSRWAFFILLLITLLLVKGAWGVYIKMRESDEFLRKSEKSLQNAHSRKVELSASIEHLKTSEGVEREIRGKFNVAKPGEEIIMIVDQKDLGKEEEQGRIPWYTRLGRFFSNLF